MKKLNRLAALLLAMVLGLSGTAFAAESSADGYTDVPDWAADYISVVTEEGLIDGKTADAFAPDENMTRVDLVVALYRLADAKVSGDAVTPFTDLDGLTDEQTAAITWAYTEEIVNGKTPTTFEPNGTILRQELAKLLNGFAAKRVGKDALTASEDVLSAFPDAADVAEWAKAPLNWAIACEFVGGTTGNRLDPEGTATRAQVSKILCLYLEDISTGDASKDDPRNGAPTKESELLVISFGTSYNDNRVATIKAIEDDMAEAFADYDVRRGFTADIIIEHVLRRDGEKIDSVKEALDKAVSAGVKDLLVQPTHLMNGYEYGDLRNLLEKKYADKFETIRIGAPLLTSDKDFAAVAMGMINATKDAIKDDKTAVCFMGHGTSADSNSIYTRMQEELKAAGYNNYFVGTVEAAPTAEDLVKLVKEAGYEKVILRPMMIVAGDHANNDMADENDPESWYSVFSAAGLEVECQVNGLGEIAEIRQLLVEHAQNAVLLSETDITSQPNPENPDNEEPETPTAPKTLEDGVYTIEVESDSSMFKVVAAELTVKDGEMTAVITLSGTGYDQMYVGTKAEAEAAAEGFIDYAEDAEGKYTFTVPVAELDSELAYAAHAVKSGNWFNRTLTFDSATAAAK